MISRDEVTRVVEIIELGKQQSSLKETEVIVAKNTYSAQRGSKVMEI